MTRGPADRPEVRAAIDRARAWLSAQVAQLALPSVSVAMVHDQELVWQEAFGDASTATAYRIGSITKPFTATALLQLRDAGRLRLDDPVAIHLPWIRDAGDGPAMTIRDILTHTTGLPREAPFPYWSDFAFPSTEDLRAAMAAVEPVHPVGWRWKYSNLAYALAGAVIEAVTGRRYADQLHESVLAPIGMTAEVEPDATMANLARGHGRRLSGAARAVRPHSDLRGLAAAGGIATTAADLARFLVLHFRDPAPGTDALSGASLREMRRVHRLDDDWQAGWGLGLRVWREATRTWAGHFGLIAGFASDMRLQPDAKVGVVVLANAEDALPSVFGQRIAQWLLPALAAAVPATPGPRTEPESSGYVGRYRDAWSDLEVLVDGAGLYALSPNWLDPSASVLRLEPAGAHAFRMRTADGFGYADEIMTFDVDGGGRATAMRIGGNPLVRVDRW